MPWRPRHLLALLALLPAACTPASATTDDPAEAERRYLTHLYERAGDLRDLGDGPNLEIGRAICEDLAAGWSPAAVAGDLAGLREPVGPAAEVMVRLSTRLLCPPP